MKWSIGKKMTAMGTGIVLAIAILAGYTTSVVGDVKENVKLAKDESVVFAGIARQMKLDVVAVQQWLTDISATRALDGLDDGFEEAEKSAKSLLDGLAKFKSMFTEENDTENLLKVEKIKEAFEEYYETGNKLANAYIKGGAEQGNKVMEEFDADAENLHKLLDPFIESQITELDTALADVLSSVENLKTNALSTALIILAVLIPTFVFFSRNITNPLGKIVAVADKIANGDLSCEIDITNKDEIGDLGKSQEAMIQSLVDIVGQISEAASQIAAGSGQVSESSQSLSQGASEQASSIEEITSSMTEMGSQTKTNAENASQASLLASNTRNAGEQGNVRMEEMVTAMSDINESSRQIAKIIKVIDDIAFQTNLLALNAAVEAARAGQHGKGFAVVAEEVRNLAGRSANAAKETAELIENSTKKVENGTNIANDTAEVLKKIVDEATKAADLVGEIAAASNEQAQGISQVNQGINQIGKVTQQSTVNAEETASASEELSSQAGQLRQLLTRFKLKDGMQTDSVDASAQKGIVHRQFTSNHMLQQHTVAPKEEKITVGTHCAQEENSEKYTVKQKESISLDDREFGKY